MVATLLPALGPSAAKLADRIRRQLGGNQADGTVAQVHGDFSADQVLVSGTEVRLIDFDRSRGGSPESDLGSFAAVEEISHWRGTAVTTQHTQYLIEGYIQAGGRLRPAAVDSWAAVRFFANIVDPFRDRRPDWAGEMSRHLDRAVELIP